MIHQPASAKERNLRRALRSGMCNPGKEQACADRQDQKSVCVLVEKTNHFLVSNSAAAVHWVGGPEALRRRVPG